MPYSFTDAGLAMQQDVKRFLDDHIYPNEQEYYEQQEEVGPSGYAAHHGQAQGRGPRAGPVEPVPAPPGAGRARDQALESRLCADLRGAGKDELRVRSAQLLGSRHRQHGDPQPLRVRARQAGLAGAVARGRDPLGVLHDRT